MYVDKMRNTGATLSSYELLRRVTSRPLALFIAGMVCMIALYVMVLLHAGSNDSLIDEVNVLGPVTLITSAVIVIFLGMRKCPTILWTPYVLYLANVAVFSGLGPLVYYFGNETTIAVLNHGPFALTTRELMLTNLLNAVGIASAATGFYLFSRAPFGRRGAKPLTGERMLHLSPSSIAVSFLVAGATLRFLVFLPAQFGQTGVLLSGSLNNLQYLFDLGLAVTAYLAAKKGGRWTLIFWILLAAHLATVILEFRKTALIIAMLLPALGAYIGHRDRKRLFLWVIAIGIVYYTAQPFVQFGRYAIYDISGDINQATLGERLAITREYFEEGNTLAALESSAEQGGWARLANSGPQAYVMRERSRGYTNDTLSDIWSIFIPRIFWSDKPIFSPGGDFYEYVTGRRGALVGITVYADAYWNLGWFGVVVISGFMGMMFSLMSRLTLHWLRTEQFVYLPAIMIAVNQAIDGPTKWVINGILGPLPIYFGYMVVIMLAKTLLSHNKRTVPRRKVRRMGRTFG